MPGKFKCVSLSVLEPGRLIGWLSTIFWFLYVTDSSFSFNLVCGDVDVFLIAAGGFGLNIGFKTLALQDGNKCWINMNKDSMKT